MRAALTALVPAAGAAGAGRARRLAAVRRRAPGPCWLHQGQTVLPGYALQSLLLALGVGMGVALLGGATAAAR